MFKSIHPFKALSVMALSAVLLLVACGAPSAGQTSQATDTPQASGGTQPPAATMAAMATTAATTAAPAATAAAATEAPATQAAATGDVPELIYYLAATGAPNALKDLADVQDAINKILVPKIGAKIKLQPISFTEAAQKTMLTLQSGEPCDLLSVSSFVPYIPAVNSGGLVPLDDLLPKYAPNLWQRLKPEWWDAARVNGKIYTAPIYNGWTSYAGFWARADLIDKYKFDWKNTKKWEDWEPLFDQILKNEKDVTPILSSDYWGQFWYPTYYGYDPIDESIGSGRGGSLIGVKIGDTTRKVQLVLDTPEYRQSIDLAHKWYTKGYLLKDIIPDNDMGAKRSQLKFGVFMFPGTGDFSTQAMADTEWNHVPIYTQHLQPKTLLTTAIGRTGYSVCTTSKHPDLAVKYIEEANQNADLLNLLNFGIEGKHWVWKDKANKVIGLPPGQTMDTASWLPNAYWEFGDRRNLYLTDPTDIGVWDRIDKGINAADISPVMGFTFNPKPVENEIAQVNTVAKEFEALNRGMVDNIDSKLADYKAKLKQSGIDKIIAEAQQQIDAWSKTNAKK
ncbi:MAG: ABC transporter substrate-binding protein [Herpetosiphonaceae bacterium]|nr:ABC transporter substrate-binding protein [Herpetosiphonaceae bacterium]